MIVFPKAKINIGLRITGKRPDGFHDIETVFYPVGLCDALEFVFPKIPEKKDTLTETGILTGCDPDFNLVVKAVKKIREKNSLPFLRIHLHKVIPSGAGLGGGSADAACILKAIKRYFGLPKDIKELKRIALELGSDCPFFIDCVPSYGTGRGEQLKPVRPVLEGYYLVLLNPKVGINTKEAYLNCLPEKPKASLIKLINKPVTEWKKLILNDFEDFAFNKYPLIGDIKKELYKSGAIFSLMSGSGSSVYGIFSGKPRLSDELKEYVIYEGLM
jgi:4-diphosphocytidyl-2-C-methyl-D-erythritol kinase